MNIFSRVTNLKAKENLLKFLGREQKYSQFGKTVKQWKREKKKSISQLREKYEKEHPGSKSSQVEVNSVDKKVEYGMTALHLAIQDGNFEKVKELVEAGADIKIKDNAGHNALDKAQRLGDKDILDYIGSL